MFLVAMPERGQLVPRLCGGTRIFVKTLAKKVIALKVESSDTTDNLKSRFRIRRARVSPRPAGVGFDQ